MPRPRNTSSSGSSAYSRRNARAQAAGYRNYYDYRTHDNGRLPPGSPRPKGSALDRLRGHNSGAAFKARIREGELVLVDDYQRGKDGRYKWVDLKVLDVNGDERIYRLKGRQLRVSYLRGLVKRIDDAGAVISPNASFDLRKLVAEVEAEEQG